MFKGSFGWSRCGTIRGLNCICLLVDQPRSGGVWRHGCGGDALKVVVTRGAAHANVAPVAVAVAAPAAVEDVALEFLPPFLDGLGGESEGEEASSI